MRCLQVLTFPNNLLRTKALAVREIGEEEKRLIARMAEIMYTKGGVGLAATQVGINKKILVVDIGDGLIPIINPEIIKRSGSEIREEGCLSVPELCVKVKRSKTISLTCQDDKGTACQIKAEGLLARVIQHEIDHLLGKLIIDYLNPIKRMLAKKRSKKLDKSNKI